MDYLVVFGSATVFFLLLAGLVYSGSIRGPDMSAEVVRRRRQEYPYWTGYFGRKRDRPKRGDSWRYTPMGAHLKRARVSS